MRNFKVLATELAEQLANIDSAKINRYAIAIFNFKVEPHNHRYLPYKQSSWDTYDWVMTLSEQDSMTPQQKVDLLSEFVEKVSSGEVSLQVTSKRTDEVTSKNTDEDDTQIWGLIHPLIIKVSKKKFDDGHLPDAVESALKAVNTRVKKYYKGQTGNELDGSDLMHHAFSPKNPVIKLGDLETETGRAIQQGYMEIFAGAWTGIRDPKAHDDISIDKTRAFHFLFLASLLMSKLDEAKIP